MVPGLTTPWPQAAASGRMAVAEALTNLLAAPIELERVKLSANWMAACGEPGEDAALFDTVRAVGLELCPALGISVPVGKDSLSMRTRWNDAGQARQVTAPVSLVVSAFATLVDVRPALTPVLQPGATSLLLIDLGFGKNRMGGSMLAQVTGQFGDEPPDLDDPAQQPHLRELLTRVTEDLLARGLGYADLRLLSVTTRQLVLSALAGAATSPEHDPGPELRARLDEWLFQLVLLGAQR